MKTSGQNETALSPDSVLLLRFG